MQDKYSATVPSVRSMAWGHAACLVQLEGHIATQGQLKVISLSQCEKLKKANFHYCDDNRIYIFLLAFVVPPLYATRGSLTLHNICVEKSTLFWLTGYLLPQNNMGGSLEVALSGSLATVLT